MIFNAYMGESTGVMDVRVKSCGHIFAQNGRAISRPRGRDDWLLFYVAKGCEQFLLDRERLATEGAFVLFAPGERQEHLCVSEKTSEFYYVHFTLPEGRTLSHLPTSAVHPGPPSARVRDLFEELLSEIRMKRPGVELITTGLLLSILGTLERNVSSGDPQRRESLDRIAAVLERISRDFAAPDTLDDLAASCNMSKFHFLRVFRSVTGASPVEYRNGVRIEHAKELLLDTNDPVSEIGLRVGYASPSYFCDAFKSRVGQSPRAYRESGGRPKPGGDEALS